jgi:hypothetical protein
MPVQARHLCRTDCLAGVPGIRFDPKNAWIIGRPILQRSLGVWFMNMKLMRRTAAMIGLGMAGVAVHCTGNAAQPAANVQFVAAGMEENVGVAKDRAVLKVYRGDATTTLHRVDFTASNPSKSLSLPKGSTYRISFESYEPDEEGATACSAKAELQVADDQRYQVSFTVLKRLCLLKAGRVGAEGEIEQIISVDGKVSRLPIRPKQ